MKHKYSNFKVIQYSSVHFSGILFTLSSLASPEIQTSAHSGLYTGPYFPPNSMPHNISVKVGDTVRLPCKVNQPGTNIVSWVRNTDYSIIAIDEDTVTHDARFFVVKSSEPSEWILVIR